MPEVHMGHMLDDGRVQTRALTTRGEVALWIKTNGVTHATILTPDEADAVAVYLHDSAERARESAPLHPTADAESTEQSGEIARPEGAGS